MKKPNFIIMGFPKCGSTALHYYLDAHPKIYMPNKKELHFFTQPNLSKLNKGPGDVLANKNLTKDLNEYLKFFKNVKNQKTVGETSPSYINYPKCFEKIKDSLGDPKIIILLRDPIKRAYSNYLHLIREQRETKSFKEALNLEDKRKEKNYSDFWYYKFNSTYYEKIVEAKKSFKDVLILTQEELNLDTIKTLKKVYNFLDVNNQFVPKNIHNKYNKGGLYQKNIITKFVFEQGKLKNIFKLCFSITPWMKNIKNTIISRFHYKPEPINADLQKQLIEVFKKDVINLTKLGVCTKHWNRNFFE